MLLKQLLESPKTSSKLVICDPFQDLDHEQLVKEVVGLANAEVNGPRNILFGVNAGAAEGSGIVGIADDDMADLKKAHRLISKLIEPVLHLAFVFDRINGKLVGALEIDGCDDGPYVIGQNSSDELSRGKCWVREGYDLRVVAPADLAPSKRPKTDEKPAKSGKPATFKVGFNDDPDSQLIEVAVPDTSNPPFAPEAQRSRQSSDLAKTIKEKVGTLTTRILRLRQPRTQDPDASSSENGSTTPGDEVDPTDKVIIDADNHYYFEEKAIKLNLVVCNEGSESVEGVSIELGFPRPKDFDVADRIYTSPFDKRSSYSVNHSGYPKVNRRDDAILVSSPIGVLAPDSPTQAFKHAMRLVVGPAMQRRKIAVNYKLRAKDGQRIADGRLKIMFGKVITS